jgi:hypothetical protein
VPIRESVVAVEVGQQQEQQEEQEAAASSNYYYCHSVAARNMSQAGIAALTLPQAEIFSLGVDSLLGSDRFFYFI